MWLCGVVVVDQDLGLAQVGMDLVNGGNLQRLLDHLRQIPGLNPHAV